jgi:hypothetical protein
MTTTLKNGIPSLLAFMLLLFLLPGSAPAQSIDRPLTVSLTGGLSFPLGRFADKEINNSTVDHDKTGVAKKGWLGALQLTYQINRHFGVSLTGGYGQYQQDGNAFKKYYEMIYGNTAVVKAKKWNVIRILAGPTYSAAISDKLLFRSGISAGMCETDLPGMTFMILNQGGNPMLAATYSKMKVPIAFAYQANAGIGYQLSPLFLLLLDLNYFDATVKHKYTPFSTSPTPVPVNQVENKYKLGAFSASLGVGFRL